MSTANWIDNKRKRWTATRIDYVESKPEGEDPHLVVRVGWDPWVDEEGRSQPACTTWEPLDALGLSWSDVKELIVPGTPLSVPSYAARGLTDEERATLATTRRLLGLKSGGVRKKKKRGKDRQAKFSHRRPSACTYS